MSVTLATWGSLLQDKRLFFDTVVKDMIGWLDPFAAKRTIDLLEYQELNSVSGSLYEIGIFHGKYFSLLVRSAYLSGSVVIGIDTFDYLPLEKFHAYFDEKFSPESLCRSGLQWSVIKQSSSALSAPDLIKKLGSEARFISIDGSHEYDDVIWDLRVAECVLSAGGIIAADDYLNPICLGVTAAIDRFLADNPCVVPFAYVSNKLFICRPGWADRYRSVIETSVLADEGDPKAEAYRVQHKAGPPARRNIEATYCGYRVLTIRL